MSQLYKMQENAKTHKIKKIAGRI